MRHTTRHLALFSFFTLQPATRGCFTQEHGQTDKPGTTWTTPTKCCNTNQLKHLNLLRSESGTRQEDCHSCYTWSANVWSTWSTGQQCFPKSQDTMPKTECNAPLGPSICHIASISVTELLEIPVGISSSSKLPIHWDNLRKRFESKGTCLGPKHATSAASLPKPTNWTSQQALTEYTNNFEIIQSHAPCCPGNVSHIVKSFLRHDFLICSAIAKGNQLQVSPFVVAQMAVLGALQQHLGKARP